MPKPETRSRGFITDLEGFRREQEGLAWEGSFSEYLEKVAENPLLLGRFAHQYVYDAIVSFGVYPDKDGIAHFKLFEEGPYAIYGIEVPLVRLMEELKAASQNQEPRKRVYLLMGPPGGGKSTVVESIKHGLEKYSRTAEGAVYAIKGCPQHDDPLKLIPHPLRDSFRREFGIQIEGDVCPHCQYLYGGDPNWTEQVKVERIFIDEQKRVGIGSFWASDSKTQEISELIGSVNLRGLGEHGVASHPDAYAFDGEFNKANRGMLEFGEMLRANEEFLRPLHSLTTERNFKVPRFGMVYADEVILGHTNYTNYYERLVKPAEAEALRRRFRVIDFPYTLRVSAEVAIYEKLIGQSNVRGVHLSPDTLRVVATWAMLTRLKPSAKVDAITKLKLYDGESPENLSGQRGKVTVKELREEVSREGMDGVPPTYVIDSLAVVMSREGKDCLNPIDALLALKHGLDKHTDTREMPEKDKKAIIELIAKAREEFETKAKREVQQAFIPSFHEAAQTLFDNYINHAIAYNEERTIEDPLTGDEVKPDEPLMRSLEEQISIPASGAKEFRRQVLADRGSRRTDDYRDYPRLKEAIEKHLFVKMRDFIKIAATTKTPDDEQKAKVNAVADRLVAKGYCPHCANHLIRFVGQMLNR